MPDSFPCGRLPRLDLGSAPGRRSADSRAVSTGSTSNHRRPQSHRTCRIQWPTPWPRCRSTTSMPSGIRAIFGTGWVPSSSSAESGSVLEHMHQLRDVDQIVRRIGLVRTGHGHYPAYRGVETTGPGSDPRRPRGLDILAHRPVCRTAPASSRRRAGRGTIPRPAGPEDRVRYVLRPGSNGETFPSPVAATRRFRMKHVALAFLAAALVACGPGPRPEDCGQRRGRQHRSMPASRRHSPGPRACQDSQIVVETYKGIVLLVGLRRVAGAEGRRPARPPRACRA